MRALVVSNMLPSAASPERGRFVRDQVEALRGLHSLDGLEIELYELAPGPRSLARGARDLRRRFAGERFDVVHAHFGLSAWPALAVRARVRALTVHGTDLRHPRTRLLTGLAIPFMDILATASAPLIAELPAPSMRRRALVLPCGVDLERFHPIPRARARTQLNLDPERPFLLFPASAARPEKRHDRALALARAAGVELRALGGVDPELVPLWVNAAAAVLVPSEREGFGLAVLEALACDVPVLATPVGVHPEALRDVAGTLCATFELDVWRAALDPHMRAPDPRISGRARAESFSAQRMAERVAAAWRAALERTG
ncbi:MAG TPA: glycosyltransferase [Solirubrobacteraceae bacterium]|nr:glycosyltransferase [Solirubrobacteraceae bacterium]